MESRVRSGPRGPSDAALAPLVVQLYSRADITWDARLALLSLAGRVGASSVVEFALGDPEPIVRRAAIAARAGLTAERRPALLSALVKDEDPGVRRDALDAIDDADNSARIAALSDPWPEVRAAAVTALGRHFLLCSVDGMRAVWVALDGHQDTIATRLVMLAAADRCGLTTAQFARFVADDEQPPALLADAVRRGMRTAHGPAWSRALERCIRGLDDGDLGNVDNPEAGDEGERNAIALAACTEAPAQEPPVAPRDRARVVKLIGTLTSLPVPNVRHAAERALKRLQPL